MIAATVLSVCDAIFDCGCAPPWAGAASHCNIHTPGPPDCPFCVGGYRFLIASIAMVGLALTGIVVVSRKVTTHFAALLAAGIAGYLLAAVASAGVLVALNTFAQTG